jgi:hypothetical protein
MKRERLELPVLGMNDGLRGAKFFSEQEHGRTAVMPCRVAVTNSETAMLMRKRKVGKGWGELGDRS